jgi:hypothetical protein
VSRIPRPSPALVVACIALTVALGGASYAAVILPKNSVGAWQLQPNSVNSSKVRNGSLLRADFKVGQVPAGQQGRTGPKGPAGPQGPVGRQGPQGEGTAPSVLTFGLASGGDASETTSTSYADLSSTTIEIPSGRTATVVATFGAESACYGANTFCGVRITLDGNEMTPSVGSDFAFDSSDGNTETSSSWESHAIVRYVVGVGSGSHTITVQYRVENAPGTLRLDDWALSVVAYRQ